jgi:ATP-dependent DNA ligase
MTLPVSSASINYRIGELPPRLVHEGSWGLAKNGQIVRFTEPMECLPVGEIPEGDLWTYELKLDGYRAIAVKTGGKVMVYSRRGTDLTQRFRYVADAWRAY